MSLGSFISEENPSITVQFSCKKVPPRQAYICIPCQCETTWGKNQGVNLTHKAHASMPKRCVGLFLQHPPDYCDVTANLRLCNNIRRRKKHSGNPRIMEKYSKFIANIHLFNTEIGCKVWHC